MLLVGRLEQHENAKDQFTQSIPVMPKCKFTVFMDRRISNATSIFETSFVATWISFVIFRFATEVKVDQSAIVSTKDNIEGSNIPMRISKIVQLLKVIHDRYEIGW